MGGHGMRTAGDVYLRALSVCSARGEGAGADWGGLRGKIGMVAISSNDVEAYPQESRRR